MVLFVLFFFQNIKFSLSNQSDIHVLVWKEGVRWEQWGVEVKEMVLLTKRISETLGSASGVKDLVDTVASMVCKEDRNGQWQQK